MQEGGDALVRVLSVADGSQPGDVVFRQGCEAPAGYPKECKSKLWREVVEGLAVSGGTACYKGTPLMTVSGPLLVADVPDGAGIR
jgi:Ni,Fe-hydrogenase I small subunit